jgi:hypothetical protein
LLDVETGDFEEGHGDVLRDGEGIEEEGLGEEVAEVVVAKVEAGGVIEGGGGTGIEPEFTGIGALEKAEDAEEKAGAGIGGAGEEGEACGLDGEGEVAQLRGRGAEMGEGLRLEQGWRHGGD